MVRRKLRAIGPAEQATRGVIQAGHDGPVMRFEGGAIDWVCPQCGHLILKGYDPDGPKKLANAAFKCRRCGTVSSPEPAPN